MNFKDYRELEKKAWKLVATKAGDEMRNASAIPNQPYWTHLVEVHMAQIVAGVTDPEELLATILHDIVEDSDITLDYIASEFSPRIAAIVELVTKPEPFVPEVFYRAIMDAEKRVGLPAMRIKVHDRINNLITNMAHNQSEKARDYAAEARRYFLPMANEVGLRVQLENTIVYIERVAA